MSQPRPTNAPSRSAAAPAATMPRAASDGRATMPRAASNGHAVESSSAIPMAPLGEGGPLVADARRIAVLRAGGLGDLVFALPSFDALRAAYPNAEIVLLGPAWAASFFAARPAPIDRVIPLPVVPGVHEPAGWVEDRADRRAFFDAVQSEAFDVAIQIHGGGRNSNPFIRRLKARISAGLQATDAPPLDRTVPYVYYQHEVLRDLAVVGLVGAAPVRLEPRLSVTADDVEQARAAVPPGTRPLAVLHPGAGDPRRRWTTESFAAVGDALWEAGADVVVTGSTAEAGLSRAVVDSMQNEAQDLGGRLSLGALTGLLSTSAAVVSNDSGPLHLAAAVGAATVGIYWCGNLVNAGPLSVARHRPAISWRLDCPDCGADCTRESCSHEASFVADVPVGEVRTAALDLLYAAGAVPAGRRRTTARRAGGKGPAGEAAGQPAARSAAASAGAARPRVA